MAGHADTELPLPTFDAPCKVLIVIAPYYGAISAAQLASVTAILDRVGVAHEVVEMPGSLEIPTAIGIAHRQADFDGYVALGCVIRGRTSHYDVVVNESARAISTLGLAGACIGNGIITVENMEQAEERADAKRLDTAGAAAQAALHLIALQRSMREGRDGDRVHARELSARRLGQDRPGQERPDRRLTPPTGAPNPRPWIKSTPDEKRALKRRMKSASRLYAVQALFQMESAGQTLDKVQVEFETHRFGMVTERKVPSRRVTRRCSARFWSRRVRLQARIDQMTDRALVEKWPLGRIDPTLRALFRAAGGEMLDADTPPKVVINEFVEVARAFFPEGKEAGFVNAVLDHMAREAKPEAF